MIELPYAGLDEAVREIVSRIVLQVEDEHARHLTEELRLQSRQLDAYASRIAELEVPLCIGRRTIGIMAEEGMWQSENGRAVVAADELFRQDPYARIAALEAALKPFADKVEYTNGTKDDDYMDPVFKLGECRAARAAMEGKDD